MESSTLTSTDTTTKTKSGSVTEGDKDVYVKVAPTSAGTGSRKVFEVWYQVGAADPIKTTEITSDDVSTLNTAENQSYANCSDANAAGWSKIDDDAFTDDTVIFATTKEKISFSGVEADSSGNSTVTVTTVNAGALENEAGDITPAITKGTAFSSSATTTTLTNKPYSFKVVPASGYEVTEVVARVYGVNGVGYDNVDLTGGSICGVYTIESVSANPDIIVNTEPLGAKAATISLTADPTGANVILSATGEPISASEAPSIKTGSAVSFEATVLPGYWIKKLEYKVGATGTLTELEPDSISLKGVFSYTIPANEVTGQVNLTFTMDYTKTTKRNSRNNKIMCIFAKIFITNLNRFNLCH